MPSRLREPRCTSWSTRVRERASSRALAGSISPTESTPKANWSFATIPWPPGAIAAQVLESIHEERFYILTHPESDEIVGRRMRAIVEGRDPDLPAPPDLAGGAL